MRIITGTARGRRLAEPKGNAIRPTTDRVKEAMFDILQGQVDGRRVLDLFGGTGQLGLEAASRGAASVDIVDRSPAALRLIRDNAARSGLAVRVHAAEALDFLRSGPGWDLILLDPPYDSPLAAQALSVVKEFDKLSFGGIILCETAGDTVLPELEAPYALHRTYRYGKVRLWTYTKQVQTNTEI